MAAKDRLDMTTNPIEQHQKFIRLYECYARDLVRFAISIVKSPAVAEELVHDAYVKILKRIEDIEDPASARTRRYLVVTVRNTCFDYLLKCVPTSELAHYESIRANPLDTVWDDFSAGEIKKKFIFFLETLSDSDRNLFVDATIRGFHYKELSAIYGISETHISVKIFRLRVKFRKFLEQED